jgi:hypothetical protein
MPSPKRKPLSRGDIRASSRGRKSPFKNAMLILSAAFGDWEKMVAVAPLMRKVK